MPTSKFPVGEGASNTAFRHLRLQGATAFSNWLLDSGHLDAKSEDDKNLVKLFSKEHWNALGRDPEEGE